MTRALLASVLFLIASLTFLSCSKSKDDDNGYYIKGKMDGISFNYSAIAFAQIFNLGSGSTSHVFVASNAANADPGETLTLSINTFGGTTLGVGEYKENNPGIDHIAGGVYNPDGGDIVWGSGIYFPSVQPMIITITSISDNEISGTFEGALYKQDSSIPAVYNEYKLVTEGEFKLRFQ